MMHLLCSKYVTAYMTREYKKVLFLIYVDQ